MPKINKWPSTGFIGGGQTNNVSPTQGAYGFSTRPTPKKKIYTPDTEKPMDQYTLSRKKLLDALEKAFLAGYESPMEMLDQEIVRIYEESFADIHAVGISPTKSKTSHQSARQQVMFDTEDLYSDPGWVWPKTVSLQLH